MKMLQRAWALGICAMASVASAQTSTILYGCVAKDGTLTIVSAATVCKGGGTKIQWNQTGPQGPAGPQGPEGVQGLQGVEGPQGGQGPSGTAGQSAQFESFGFEPSGLVLSDSGETVVKSINVPASSGTSLLITYGSFFSNPVGECTVQNAIYVDGAWVNDRWTTVPGPLEPGGSISPKNYGWASLSGTWVINDGSAAHQIELRARPFFCGDALQMQRPYLLIMRLRTS